MKFRLAVVGCGGTGSAFLQKLARFSAASKEDIEVIIVDGDMVEEKNLVRQNFFESNINQSKALSLVYLASSSYGLKWKAVPEYVVDKSQLENYFYSNEKFVCNILVGCVDNHRARQVMEEWFDEQTNCFYIDSANDEFDGEIVVSAKADGIEVAPRRSFYFPEVSTDNSPSVVELSCEARNISTPQHQLTNDLAGNLLLSVVCKILKREVPTGLILFDIDNYNVKRLPFVNGKLEVENDVR